MGKVLFWWITRFYNRPHDPERNLDIGLVPLGGRIEVGGKTEQNLPPVGGPDSWYCCQHSGLQIDARRGGQQIPESGKLRYRSSPA